MSTLLVEQLYQQVKRVMARPIAVISVEGKVFEQANDFPGVKRFTITDAINQEKRSLSIEGKKNLRAIPLSQQEKIIGLLVVETSEEDSQTIQVLSSLAELIIQQFVDSHKLQPDAVDLLLTRLTHRPTTIDQEELEQQMAALGYRMDVQRVAVVLKLVGFWDNYLQSVGQPLGEKKNLIVAKKHDIEQALASFFTKNQDNIIGYIGAESFVVLKDLSTTEYGRFCDLFKTHFKEITSSLKNVYITEVKAGISAPSQNLEELINAPKDALQILEIGERIDSKRGVYLKKDLGIMPLLLSDSLTTKREFADSLLSDLTDHELLETLAAFLGANLNLTQTSESLKIHRNTVIYRLDKISELLGKDPRQFEDAVELYVALRFRQVFGDNRQKA